MAGRHTKLTPDLRDRIVDQIRNGVFAAVACQAVGIGESTYYRWLERGQHEQDRQDAERDQDPNKHLIDTALTTTPDPNPEEPYREFREAVRASEAQAEAVAVAVITRAGFKDARHMEWYLERKHPTRWARRTHVTQELSGPGGGPVEVDAEALLVSFLDGRADALEGTDEPPTD